MEWARLNVFQRITRQWDSLHPYNAAQVMKIAGRADRDAAAGTWAETISQLGLGRARVRGNRFQWEAIDGRTVGGEMLFPSDETSLEKLLSSELNRPFEDSSETPFRPLIIQDRNSHYVGVVYHHWVADSYSIRLLLREWFLRMHDPSAARRTALRIARDGYWRRFGPEQAGWNLGGALLEMLRWSARLRRARRVDRQACEDLSVRFSLHHASAGLLDVIVPAAKRLGVTVNDLFLAAMAQVCDELAPVRRTRRRQDLALGTIVDLRSRAARRMDEEFGLFLGFTSVLCHGDAMTDPRRLLRLIHQQNLLQKRTAAAESSMVRISSGLVAAKLLKPEQLLEFYRKRLSLAGGISNVNLNRDWPARYSPWPLLDYIRVSPCGPMMPLVFTPTTLGDSLNFGLTCRSSVVPCDQSSAMADSFITRLKHLAAS